MGASGQRRIDRSSSGSSDWRQAGAQSAHAGGRRGARGATRISWTTSSRMHDPRRDPCGARQHSARGSGTLAGYTRQVRGVGLRMADHYVQGLARARSGSRGGQRRWVPFYRRRRDAALAKRSRAGHHASFFERVCGESHSCRRGRRMAEPSVVADGTGGGGCCGRPGVYYVTLIPILCLKNTV